jgi:hypothetical protein
MEEKVGLKLSIDYKYESTNFAKEMATLLETTKINEEINQITRIVINSRERAIRQTLITMGWTPPNES